MSNTKRVTIGGVEMFPKRYASGSDLRDKSFTLEIAKITREEMINTHTCKTEQKYVIYFFRNRSELTKGFVLGREFAQTIASALNDANADHWPNKHVEIYPKQTRLGVGVRARRAQNSTTPPPLTITEEEEEEEDEIQPERGESMIDARTRVDTDE